MQIWRDSAMQTGRFATRVALAAALFAVVIGISAGLSIARAQNGGVIRACVNNFIGQVRILSGGGQCTPGERALSWNQLGPGGIIDIQRVATFEQINTDDQVRIVDLAVICPAGYNVVDAGASRGVTVGNDLFVLVSSEPRLAGDQGANGRDGWTASFQTVDNEEAVGDYLFDIEALCVLTS
jgi:hypothetical protein